MINHSKSRANVSPKIIEIDGYPSIYFVSKTNIDVGEELQYDYKDNRKHVIILD